MHGAKWSCSLHTAVFSWAPEVHGDDYVHVGNLEVLDLSRLYVFIHHLFEGGHKTVVLWTLDKSGGSFQHWILIVCVCVCVCLGGEGRGGEGEREEGGGERLNVLGLE